ARERSLAEAAHPCVRTHPGRPPRTAATHPREKIPTFLHLSDLGKRESLNTDGAKRWNTWREVEYCGCYRSRWVSKGVRRHVVPFRCPSAPIGFERGETTCSWALICRSSTTRVASSCPQSSARSCRPDSYSPVARRIASPCSPPRSSKPSTRESRTRRRRIRKPAITSVCSCRRHLRTNRTNRDASRSRTYCGSTHH